LALEARLAVIYRRQAPPLAPAEPGIVARDPLTVRRVLRGLRRAEPALEPAPHSSLGLPAYVQVTSPLRRYQDLATHRQIVAHLAGAGPAHDLDAMQRILATTEQAELDARRAERSADEYWTLRYLETQVGSDVEALVTETEPRPIVQLVDTLREQPLPSLSGAAPGDRVRLRVERVNPRAGLLVLRVVR
jgi:exoribonuclease-2